MPLSDKVIIETERLYLTEFTPDIAEEFYKLNEDEEVLRYTGDVPFASVKDASDFLENYKEYKNHGHGRWSVWQKSDNAWLGWCGLRKNEIGEVDIGFRFHRPYWNQGFATEAAKASLDFGFKKLKIHEIIARCNSSNFASIKVIKKLSLQYWKTDTDIEMGETTYFRISRQAYLSNPFSSTIK